MQVKSLFFEASPLRNSLILESPRQVNGLKSIWEWMQCLIRTFPHFLQGIAKYRITWEQNARRQSTNELCWEQSMEGKTVEWASSANPVSLIPPPRWGIGPGEPCYLWEWTEIIHGSLSAVKQWWIVILFGVSDNHTSLWSAEKGISCTVSQIWAFYVTCVHHQAMMIGANLAVSRSFLCRRSDEWCGELMSTVSSSGNSRQRASPTEGSTSCKTSWS